MNQEVYALVTGGSKGIGKAIAFDLAKRGQNILLVARNEAELTAVALELTNAYKIKVDFFVADLSLPDAAENVFNWVVQNQYAVNTLVNNAGFGTWGAFADLSLAEQQQMLSVNVNALVNLTYLFLPILKTQVSAYVLNISSTAAYQALPTLAVYAATKTFVLSFSRAINYELKDTSVSVTCVCPGPVATNFASRAGMMALDKMAQKFNMQPNEVAEFAVAAMFKRKVEAVPGFTNKVGAFASRLFAKRFLEKTVANIYKV